MKQVEYDADTLLQELLDELKDGGPVTITRHGRPIARLVPVDAKRRTPAEAVEALLDFRAAHPLGDLNIRDLIEDGRRL